MPINVTLLFSREQYLAAAEAYLRGIERRIAAGLNPQVASVASVFISRWDAAVAEKVPAELRNRLGIAIAGRLTRPTSNCSSSAALATHIQRRRPAPTAAVGQHRDQGPQGVRHSLHQEPWPRLSR